MQHPAGNKTAAAADNVHNATFTDKSMQNLTVDTAVDRHKISTVGSLLTNNFKQVLFRHFHNGTAFFNSCYRCLINRYRTNHYSGGSNDSLARSIDIVACRKIHHRIGTGINSSAQLSQLRFRIRIGAGGTDIGIDLD